MFETLAAIIGLLVAAGAGVWIGRKLIQLDKKLQQTGRKKQIKNELTQAMLDEQYQQQAAREILAQYAKTGRLK
jgi:hypothetical protein